MGVCEDIAVAAISSSEVDTQKLYYFCLIVKVINMATPGYFGKRQDLLVRVDSVATEIPGGNPKTDFSLAIRETVLRQRKSHQESHPFSR